MLKFLFSSIIVAGVAFGGSHPPAHEAVVDDSNTIMLPVATGPSCVCPDQTKKKVAVSATNKAKKKFAKKKSATHYHTIKVSHHHHTSLAHSHHSHHAPTKRFAHHSPLHLTGPPCCP